MRFWLAGAIVGFFLISGNGAVAGQQHSEQQADDRLPFQLRNGFLILVEGRIGSLSPLKFVLDTGTTHTMVDERIAKRLSLKRRSGDVLNFNRFVRIEWANVSEIQFGPLTARDLPVMVGHLRHYSEFAAGVDAIIGLDLLSTSQHLRIDYSTNRITVRTVPPGDERKTAPPPALTILLSLQGQPARFVLDSGLQSMLLYRDRIRGHLSGLRFDDKVSRVHIGNLAAECATLSGVRAGNKDLQLLVFLLSRSPDSLSADIDGYIGTSALGAKVIELDFASKTLRLELKKEQPCGEHSASCKKSNALMADDIEFFIL